MPAGFEIHFQSDKKLVNLTNNSPEGVAPQGLLWKAAGKPYNKRPNDFTSSVQAQELIEILDENRSGEIPLLKTVRGRGNVVAQGTYAHRA